MNLRWKPTLDSLDERITPSGYRDAPVSGGIFGGIPVVAADNCPDNLPNGDGYAYTTDEHGRIIDCMVLTEPTWPDMTDDGGTTPPPTPPPTPDDGDGDGGGKKKKK